MKLRRPALVNEALRAGLPIGQAALTATRANLRTAIYGAVDFAAIAPTAIIRSHNVPASPPVGTDHMDRFAYSNTCGRGGLTYSWLLYPTASPIGMLAVCYSAHGTKFDTTTTYHMASLSASFLAQGCHVLAIDQPCYTPTNQPLPIVLNGINVSDHTFGGHALPAGPDYWRVFLDCVFAGLNQVVVDLAPSRIVAAGLSGGGLDVEMLAALDTRISASYAIFPEYPGLSNVDSNATDWEYNGDPAYPMSTCMTMANGGYADVRAALRGDNGRRSVTVWGDGDNVFSSAGKHAIVARRTARIQTMLGGVGSYDAHYDTQAGTHDVTAQTTAWIWADIIAQP